MPHVGSEVDANFYQLIHRMLESPDLRAMTGGRRSDEPFARPSESPLGTMGGFPTTVSSFQYSATT